MHNVHSVITLIVKHSVHVHAPHTHVHSVMHNVCSAIRSKAQCTQCHNTPYMYTLHIHLYSVLKLHAQAHSVITLYSQCTQCYNITFTMHTVL